MSAVVWNDHEYEVYVKGSPEKILDLCDPETIPYNFENTLVDYTA